MPWTGLMVVSPGWVARRQCSDSPVAWSVEAQQEPRSVSACRWGQPGPLAVVWAAPRLPAGKDVEDALGARCYEGWREAHGAGVEWAGTGRAMRAGVGFAGS